MAKESGAIAPKRKKSANRKKNGYPFKSNDYIVYPSHGVGKVVSVEKREIVGESMELFVISFEEERMTLRVPIAKAESTGMRALSDPDTVEKALNTLKGRARVKRIMWSRRAQEYEHKINSGDMVSIAEVVRDLHRCEDQPEQSYSERQLYEAALERLTRELAAVEKIDGCKASKRVEDLLDKRIAAA